MKMIFITKETYENNGLEVIDNIGILWLNEKYIEEESGHKNLLLLQTNMTQCKNVN